MRAGDFFVQNWLKREKLQKSVDIGVMKTYTV